MVKPKQKLKPSPFTFKPVKLNSNPMFFGARPQKKSLFSGFGVKPDMNWKQAKKAYPKLKPFADADRDGVRNKFDCKPFDKTKQGPGHIVKDKRKLNAMAKRGFIKLHEDTGKKVVWQGRQVRANYVDDGKPVFKHDGKRFKTKYQSGSFFPYVEEIDEAYELKKNEAIKEAKRRNQEEYKQLSPATEKMIKMGEDDMDESVKRYNESDSPGTMRRLSRKPGSNIIEADFVEATGSDLSDADIEDIMDSDEDPAKYF